MNWEERAYVNMYKARKERLRDTDKQVQLLMEHGGEKVRLRTEGSHLRPVTTWTGKPSTAVIDGWETQVGRGPCAHRVFIALDHSTAGFAATRART